MADEQETVATEESPQPPGWTAQLPDDYKADETFHQFKTLGDLAKSYKETSAKAQELEGKLPQAPESPDAYEFEESDLPIDEEFLKSFKETAHKNGMTKEQAKEVVSMYTQNVKAQIEAQTAARQEQLQKTEADLKKEWGDQFDTKKEYMRKGIEQFGDDKLNELLNTAEVDGVILGNHPLLIKYLANIGEAMTDDNWTPKDKLEKDYNDGIIIRGDDSVMAQYRQAQ